MRPSSTRSATTSLSASGFTRATPSSASQTRARSCLSAITLTSRYAATPCDLAGFIRRIPPRLRSRVPTRSRASFRISARAIHSDFCLSTAPRPSPTQFIPQDTSPSLFFRVICTAGTSFFPFLVPFTGQIRAFSRNMRLAHSSLAHPRSSCPQVFRPTDTSFRG